MEITQILEHRTSCRAFTDREVSREVLERLLSRANRSPSYMNTQPWEVYLAAGERKDRLAARLYEAAGAGAPLAPDLPFPAQWPAAHEGRMKAHRLRRFQSLDIDPEREPEKVRESYLRNFRFFNAPCIAVFGFAKALNSWSIFDMGLFVQSFLLAAYDEGLGACPQAMPTAYADLIREELEIPGEINLSLVVSLGYPDHDAPANRYRSLRRGLEEFTHWQGF
ncbi:MAG: nitroreductase [Smithellaceae bacterium]|nr:nitroreductase [Smithellaceae bacterium]